MKKKVNAEEAEVVNEVNSMDEVSFRYGLAVVSLTKGENPQDDKLKSILYVTDEDGSYKKLTKIEGKNLSDVMNSSLDKLVNEGLTTNEIDITYHHSLVSEIVGQELRANKEGFINGLRMAKSEYESMSSNSFIEFSEDQKTQINSGIKVIDKLIERFEGTNKGGE